MISLALGGALALTSAVACGGDDDNDNPDASTGGGADASTADAAPPVTQLRSGTVAITQAEVAGLPGAIGGAVNLISFNDLTTDTGTPVPGYTMVPGCSITIYDVAAGDTQAAPVDEGPVTVTGTNNGPFACGFNADLNDYLCQSTDATIAGGTAGNANGLVFVAGANSSATLTAAANGTFDATMLGMSINLTGFATDGVDGSYAITNVNGAGNALTLYSPAAPAPATTSTGDATSTYTTFVGTGPFPGGFDYLQDATDIKITKDASDKVGAIDQTFQAAGNGLVLASNPDMGFYTPDQIPFDMNPVTFSCATADGGDCGMPGMGILTALVVNGVTTDGEVNPADPTDMPAPVNKFATFTCAFLTESGTLDAGAMQAILGTNPTRIRTTVGRFAGNILTLNGGEAKVNVVVGHEIIGYSSPAPAAK